MIVIIPARYASMRLPAKALADVCGQPLVQRVHACARASSAQRVIVATDDRRIAAAVEDFGGEACMTAATHASGTDRIAEVIRILDIAPETIIVNLQGDEPLMPPSLIDQVAGDLAAHPTAAMATACHAIEQRAAFENPNVVKVVFDRERFALYFSRAPIPWPRDAEPRSIPAAYRHIGLYAYRAGFIGEYAAWPVCPPERAESLEQLRVLWNGRKIVVAVAATAPGTGVDTPDDLAQVRRHFSQHPGDR